MHLDKPRIQLLDLNVAPSILKALTC